jgi:hypothetical protein
MRAGIPLLLVVVAAAACGLPARADSAPVSVAPVLVAPGELDPWLDASQRSELRFLDHLGWRVVRDPAATGVEIRRGNPWARRDRADLRAARDLEIALPAAFTAAHVQDLGRRLALIADGLPSRAAYKILLEPAVVAATKKLDAAERAGRYLFPEILGIGIPIFTMNPPRPEWVRESRVCRARASPSAAIEAFYERGSVMECYAAQWIAIFATQYELYGPEWFDEAFESEELVLGRPPDIREFPIGSRTKVEIQHPWRALVIPEAQRRYDASLVLAQYGPRAFTGVTGIVLNQDPETYSNENVMIVSASPAVLEQLRRGGGLCVIAQRSKEAWVQYRRSTGWFTSHAIKAPAKAALESVLSEPVFSELMVYGHPYGVVPLRVIVEKKMAETRSPVYLQLYLNGVEDFLYQRYREAWKRRYAPEVGGGPPLVADAPAAVVPAAVVPAGGVPDALPPPRLVPPPPPPPPLR